MMGRHLFQDASAHGGLGGGSDEGSRFRAAVIAVIVLSSFGLISMVLGFAYYWYIRRRSRLEAHKQNNDPELTESEKCVSQYMLPAISLSQSEPQIYTFKHLQLATNDFSSVNIIGHGSSGTVYRAVLENGRRVAIKQLERGGKRTEEEFRVEVDMLSHVHSSYLVELIGYCADGKHRLLVFEYMANGSLQEHLYPGDQSGNVSALDWKTRMRIALDAARGLEYLHEFMSPPIIHRDFKCSNVLLDDKFSAKLSDFGLAKFGSEKLNGDVATRVLGTHGYVAPEYVLTGHLTTKSDVYSYGVVLLELLTGRVPVDMKRPSGQGVLVSWALPRLTDRDKLVEMVDSSLHGQYTMKELIQVAAIAAMCVQPEADYRPLMTDVVQSLLPLVRRAHGRMSIQQHFVLSPHIR